MNSRPQASRNKRRKDISTENSRIEPHSMLISEQEPLMLKKSDVELWK
jgi:hypothetical protein